jgi:ubiquinol-cytochrome c reductase cytochrome b subunit
MNRVSLWLPRLGLSALMLCLASGIVLLFHYRPMGNVFRNVEEITTLVPYGWFFRQLHYGAGQVFVILMLLHTLDHLVRRRYRMYPFKDWVCLTLSLAICFYTLFTGFILKGDQEGTFAGRIFQHIMETIPMAGRPGSRLLITPGEGFFFLPYLYHCFFLPVLMIYLMRGHVREWLPDRKFFVSTAIGLSLYALLVKPGVGIPPEVSVPSVAGPWFFQGIQTLLRILPPFLAGIVIPGLFMGCLLLLPARGTPLRAVSYLHPVIIIALMVYGILTLRAAVWGP